MEINCEFRESRCTIYPGKYTCSVTKALITDPRTRIKAFKGTHVAGKANIDVEALSFKNTKVEYFPRGLHRIFHNLKLVFIDNCETKEISRKDLAGLEILEAFGVVRSHLKKLPNDLFLGMSKLNCISFFGNQ